jgi:hypothetical protein
LAANRIMAISIASWRKGDMTRKVYHEKEKKKRLSASKQCRIFPCQPISRSKPVFGISLPFNPGLKP